MKGIKHIAIFVAITTATITHLQAQPIDTKIVHSFNPSIVSKVFEVANRVALRPEQIIRLAEQYNRHDSLVAEWLLQRRPYNEIDSLNGATGDILNRVLDEKQLYSYNDAKGNNFAKTATTGELAYINETYKPDSGVYKVAQNMLEHKYANIFGGYLNEGSDEKTFASLVSLRNKNYDLFNLYPVLYSKRYVDEYIEKITAIKPIPDSTLQHIINAFHAQAYYAKYDEWGNVLNRVSRWYLTDTAIYSNLYRAEFEKQAFELSAADSYNLIYLNRVLQTAYDSIYNLIKEKNYKKVLLQYTYAFAYFKTYDTLIRQVTHYYDSAVEASLLRVGALQPTTQFAIALKYKDIIGFDQSMTDVLLSHAMYLAKERDSIIITEPFAVIDFGAYEAKVLSGLLTEDQYNVLLTFKNKFQALADAKGDWAEMELRGITAGFDKDEAIRQMYEYYLAKYNAWNRFAYDKIKQWATVDAMGNNKPQALKLLDPIRWSGTTQKPANNMKLKW